MRPIFLAIILSGLLTGCSKTQSGNIDLSTDTNQLIAEETSVPEETSIPEEKSDVIEMSDYREVWKENNKKMFLAICKLLKDTPATKVPTTYSFLADGKWYEWYLARYDTKFQQGTEFEKRRMLADANLKSELEEKIINVDLNDPIQLGVVSAEADSYNFETKEYKFQASPLDIPGLEIHIPNLDKNYDAIIKLDEKQAEELEKNAERGFLGGVNFQCDVYHQFYLKADDNGNPTPLTRCVKVIYYSSGKKIYEQLF